MGLIADLLAATRNLPPLYAAGVAVGPRFTAVTSAPSPSDPATGGGLAFTGPEVFAGGADPVTVTSRVRPDVLGRALRDLAQSAPGQDRPHFLPRGGPRSDVATAALNALLAAQVQGNGAPLGDENGLDLIVRRSAGRRLAMVGAFPYLKTVPIPATRMWVLELDPAPDETPASLAPDVLPQADVVGITGSAFANGTLEGLLALCRPGAFVAVIGPTTPLSPVLFEYGVDVLCGVLVDDPALIPESVLVSGTARRVPGTRQVSVRR